jgi:hypothetical protein
MMPRTMILFLGVLSILGLTSSLVSGASGAVVADINANKLLCTIAANYDFTVGLQLPNNVPTMVEKDTPPRETVTIVRQHNTETLGRRYALARNGVMSGEIQLGVFSDPNTALRVFADYLRHTSVAPDRDLATTLGTRAVAWAREGQSARRVLFARDNVVVSVSLLLWRLGPASVPNEATLDIAKNIDGALVKGVMGVQRGPTLLVPRITRIETSGEMSPQGTLTAQVHIAIPENPQDRESREVETVRTLRFHTPSLSAEDKIASENKVTYYVTYVTPGCVVASQKMTRGY